MSGKTCYECGGNLKVVKDQAYKYTECGLENVFLYGVNQYVCEKCHETSVTIPMIEQLHLVIGRGICCQKELLNGAEIRFLRKELHMKAKALAGVMGVAAETLSRWENGGKAISEASDRFLRSLYMLYASEQNNAVLHRDTLKFFSELSSKRQVLPLSTRIELTTADWMGPQPEFCLSQ
jgi:putative zinc finger/helix-turn-helix YgiT family protein